MEGWRLAVLLVIIIVFLIVLGIYALVLYMHKRGMISWGSRGPTVVGAGASDTVLYFRDAMTQTLHSLDLKLIKNAADFRFQAASLCGRSDPIGVALSRVDEGNVLVELDLEQFLASPYRGDAVRRSALEPFVLSHHLHAHVPRTPQQSVMHSVMQSPSRQIEASAMTLSPRKRRTITPRPYIFPSVPLITTNTFIILSASAFLDPNTGEPLVLTDGECTGLEWAFIRGESSVDLGDGVSASLNVKYSEAAINVGSSLSNRAVPTTRRVQRHIFRRIMYAIDTGGNSSDASLPWTEYAQPFRLPLGRWCVRVQASTDDQRTTESIARVFTVEATAS
ncbi:membrane-associated protein, putative [Bodo saltans]|uniref:Membrane-associated protein, putative n=1 Tax=Bodo saltans TaxID=75058 RepID=A0A0S4JVG6_BODSA|nr:membrane-associated protein, putative [Bodo saltans]|eukprot:CUG93393.1 membrane-associated protein, putative [Bodo saltans]